MKIDTTIVNELMTKYNLTKKDLFSFCICAVNFLEYFEEESMGDMMRDCPDRYFGADSNNTRAVAGALTGEKKSMGWTDEDQFAYYMECIQDIINSEIKDTDLSHFLEEYQRFEKVYKREILVPIMLGCDVEDYDDSKFYDEDYIESIVNADNLMLYKAYEEQREAENKAYMKKEEEALAKEVEKRADDTDFSVLLAASIGISDLKETFEKYNKTYYPGREYKVIPLKPQLMIIQTGGKSIEDVKERILKIVKGRIMLLGHETKEELIPIEKAFNVIPQVLYDNKVTHVVTYF